MIGFWDIYFEMIGSVLCADRLMWGLNSQTREIMSCSRMLNQLSHPGAPRAFFFFLSFIDLFLRETEREHEQGKGRGAGTEDLKQAPCWQQRVISNSPTVR